MGTAPGNNTVDWPFKAVTPVSVELVQGLTLDEWVLAFKRLPRSKFSTNFYLGDCMLYGERNWPNKSYEEAMQASGLTRATLLNYRWVCKMLPH